MTITRAIELRNEIVAFMETYELNTDELIVVKDKISRSKWYERAGELHGRSQYFYCAPKQILHLVQELHDIRKSNEGNREFEFHKCENVYVVERVADHCQDEISSYEIAGMPEPIIELTEEQKRNIFINTRIFDTAWRPELTFAEKVQKAKTEYEAQA